MSPGATHTDMRLSKHRHRVITNIHLAMSEYTHASHYQSGGLGVGSESQLIKSVRNKDGDQSGQDGAGMRTIVKTIWDGGAGNW